LRGLRKVTEDERERRFRELEVLGSKKIKLDSRFQNITSSSSRNQLFDAANRNKLFDDDDEDEDPIIDNRGSSVETYRAEQQQILRQQDNSLDALSQVIARQKNIAIRIGDEVENQNDIIDNLAEQMDSTNSRTNAVTRNVSVAADRDSTFGYWVVIVSLFVVIIVLAIL
jgi:syntaxin 8